MNDRVIAARRRRRRERVSAAASRSSSSSSSSPRLGILSRPLVERARPRRALSLEPHLRVQLERLHDILQPEELADLPDERAVRDADQHRRLVHGVHHLGHGARAQERRPLRGDDVHVSHRASPGGIGRQTRERQLRAAPAPRPASRRVISQVPLPAPPRLVRLVLLGIHHAVQIVGNARAALRGGEREETQQSQQARSREDDAAAREARDTASASRGIARAHHLSVGRSGSNTTEVGRGSRSSFGRENRKQFTRSPPNLAVPSPKPRSGRKRAIAESRNRAETQTAQGNRVC